MMPVSSLSIMLLPAPLPPTIPNASPRARLNETSRSAQNSRSASTDDPLPETMRRVSAGTRSRSESNSSPRRNFFETPRTSIAMSLIGNPSHALGEQRLELREHHERSRAQERGEREAVAEPRQRGALVIDDGGGQRLEQRRDRIYQHQGSPGPEQRRFVEH